MDHSFMKRDEIKWDKIGFDERKFSSVITFQIIFFVILGTTLVSSWRH